MEQIILTAKSGLIVEMSSEEYAVLSVKYGSRVREIILSDAGRVLKHRGNVRDALAQVLTNEQKQQVEALANAYARQNVINEKIVELGYGNYLMRSERGGMMPASWDRIVSQASEGIDETAIIADDSDRERAMNDLGLWTDGDLAWSKKITNGNTWKITAPAGWGAGDPVTRSRGE